MVRRGTIGKQFCRLVTNEKKKYHFHLLVRKGHPDLIQKNEKTVSMNCFHFIVQQSFRSVYRTAIATLIFPTLCRSLTDVNQLVTLNKIYY